MFPIDRNRRYDSGVPIWRNSPTGPYRANFPFFVALSLLSSAAVTEGAEITNSTISSADSFLATGSSNNPSGSDLTELNFGSAGALAVAPATSLKGEFKTVLRFNLASATNLFTQTFGPNWIVTGASLELASNFGGAGEQPNNPIFNVVSGGNFVIQWLADDSWIEGTGNVRTPATDGVSYSSLPTLLLGPVETLCTNTYSPPGDNVRVAWPLPLKPGFLANLMTGGDVSFLLSAIDNQIGYLFNSLDYGRGNEPMIRITAGPLLEITRVQLTNGVCHIEAIGGKNMQYNIQAAAGLPATNWQTIATVSADSMGAIQFDDPSVSNLAQRFYRLSN